MHKVDCRAKLKKRATCELQSDDTQVSASQVQSEDDSCSSAKKRRVYENVPVEKQKQQCPGCKKYYLNLQNHNKCRARLTDQNTAQEVSDPCLSASVKQEQQQQSQCPACKNYFVNLAKHINCQKTSAGSVFLTPRKSSAKVGNTDSGIGTNSTVSNDSGVSHSHKTRRSGATRKDYVQQSASEQLKEMKTNLKKKVGRKPKQADPRYEKLKEYHDSMKEKLSNTTTEKVTTEVLNVVINPDVIGQPDRKSNWDGADRLNEMNRDCKLLQSRDEWTWKASDDSPQGQYNNERMDFCVNKECVKKIIPHCKVCGTTGLLVGLDQINADTCYDCLKDKWSQEKETAAEREKKLAWEKVRPVSNEYPKRVEPGHEHEDLPSLQPGDKAVISPIQPCVTIKKNHFADKKLRLESVSLVQNCSPTLCKILPWPNAKGSYLVIERRSKDDKRRYIVANPERVRQWLRYFFKRHPDFIRLQKCGELTWSEAAVAALESQELAEVDAGIAEHGVKEAENIETEMQRNDDGLVQPELASGFSETHVFSFDRYPNLYLNSKEFLRIRKEGKIEILEDSTIRRPTYNSSATLAFPHLYPNGEMSPLDFGEYKLARYLLKKQSLFAHRMADGRLRWRYAEDDIHMAHQLSRVQEQTVHATVGYYVSQHPDVAHVSMDSVVKAFAEGFNDQGLLDSHLPDLTCMMSQVPNSRQRWFSERLGLEAIARDLGDPNLFLTINMDPRAWPDVRGLVYELEYGEQMPRDHPFEKDTAVFTKMMSKYAPHVAIYLYRKCRLIVRAFLCDICGIPEKETGGDFRKTDTTDTGYFWGRCEWSETRGILHYHYLVKLPHTLDTAIIGRCINNGRVCRQEMKCGNIRADKMEEAWRIIEMGLLASRYAVLFAESISTASFYSEDIDVDSHDDDKVVQLEKHREEFAKNYKAGNINLNTHPIMRRFGDPECDPSKYVEVAKVAAVSCVHKCITAACGGNPVSGEGCRFSFPRNKMKYTVPAVMQVNANQMEARMLLKRTCEWIPCLNTLLLRYVRSNHDVSVLIDAAHKMRYATKYASKSDRHAELLDEVIEHLNKRSTDLLPPNMKQTLSHLVLADSSHRAFMSKPEVAYRVMNLPEIDRSFSEVHIVGFYPRANLKLAAEDNTTIEFSDRTEYSAYAERCRKDTVVTGELAKFNLQEMTFDEFVRTVIHRWSTNADVQSQEIGRGTKRKLRTRDVDSGHWILSKRRSRLHVRPSTVLYTAPAIDYELVEFAKTTTQTTFFDLPTEKRNQLYRSYYELVQYVPWQKTPDKSFLSKEVQEMLEDKERHAELDSRHSLMRLEEFFKVYKQMWQNKKIAPPGSTWHRDNQYSYSMYLVSRHNRDMHQDRANNKGVLQARYENSEELTDVDVDIRPDVPEDVDDSDFPTFQNFMPADTFRDIMEQKPMDASEIGVAFPLQNDWQTLEELVVHNTAKRFLANPPPSPVSYEDMTPVQQWAVDLGVDPAVKILYLCGKAGTGKTTVALKICEMLKGHVQAGACTGKAASNFNGPTNHSMFGWSREAFISAATQLNPDSRKIQQIRTFYEDTDTFVIDEVNAMPAASLALLHETMTAVFNKEHRLDADRRLLPFGGKKMIFLGDPAQLRPVAGAAIYDDGQASPESRKKASRSSQRTAKGQELYRQYLVPNCVFFNRGQRNAGLLGYICDRIREGTQDEDDLIKLTVQRRKFPDVVTDYGIQYENEMCSMHNWRQLWADCSSSTPARRMFICKATYESMSGNEKVIDALASLPPKSYGYAPDVLCVAEGCDVRLVQNVNVAAGLVNSASGTVVKVVFNNAETRSLMNGDHVPPYCIVVDFPGFHGFLQKSADGERRIFPFPKHRQWVPVYRQKFAVSYTDLPSWVRKKQMPKDCYRLQFPLDLSRNITCHRAQGQTLADTLVSVDLGLDNPDKKLPQEIGSIVYVACTRVKKLEHLFVSPIFPSVWEKIGKTEMDQHRRTVEAKLRTAAGLFASNHGMYAEVKAELNWAPDYSGKENEWKNLSDQTLPPTSLRDSRSQQQVSQADFEVVISDRAFSMCLTPVLSERHIGLDQGIYNFGIAVVEVSQDDSGTLVFAENYTDLDLPENFKVDHVLESLTDNTDLMSWMEPENTLSKVDRVVVHLEQIDPRNRKWKQFSVELGRLLQQRASDSTKCIVKMSQPHILRATGPAFRLGQRIIEKLQLIPPHSMPARSLAEQNPATNPSDVAPEGTDDNVGQHSDVSPVTQVDRMSDVEPDDIATDNIEDDGEHGECVDVSPDLDEVDCSTAFTLHTADDESQRYQYSSDSDDEVDCCTVFTLYSDPSDDEDEHECFEISSDSETDDTQHNDGNDLGAKKSVETGHDVQPIIAQAIVSQSTPAVVPSGSDVESISTQEAMSRPQPASQSNIYRQKKKMSANIFKYIVEADAEDLADLPISVHDRVKEHWKEKLTQKGVKLDDVGDALLHALDEILCGSNNFQQLVTATPSLHNNRTVALAMFPSVTFWIVLNCTWNMFVLENFGWYDSKLEARQFKDKSTVHDIKKNIHPQLNKAVGAFRSTESHAEVDQIKVIVKQLTGHTDYQLFSNKEAGALTQATTAAMKMICDETVGPNSNITERRDDQRGNTYTRTAIASGNKYHVMNSTGKHTNAILSCLEWMKEHVPDYVKERRAIMNEREKIKFFDAVHTMAHSENSRIEMLYLSEHAKNKLKQCDEQTMQRINGKRNIADLILVGMSKNLNYIKAIAANSRRKTTAPKTVYSKKHRSKS